MKKLTGTLITLTAIGLAVRVNIKINKLDNKLMNLIAINIGEHKFITNKIKLLEADIKIDGNKAGKLINDYMRANH